MSRHSPHRLSLTYQAILATTLGFSTLSANALTLGQPSVQSEQHEPLSATINVSNIDANNFNASLASGAIYQQMGLSQVSGVSVRFVKTSDTAGRIVLSSSQPISTPFADIVLDLDNNGEQRIEPQTLLMPLPSRARVEPVETPPVMVAATEDTPVNLPVVSSVELEPVSEPLQVQMVAPPPVFAEVEAPEANVSPIVAATTEAPTEAQSTDTTASVAEAPKSEPEAVKPTAPPAPVSAAAPKSGQVISENERVISSITPEGTNTQINILTEQITRRVLPAGTTAPLAPTPSPMSEPAIDASVTPSAPTPSSDDVQTGTATYVVQSGDNLWSIANQIAMANNMDVSEVMTALHAQNPDAFNRGRINQLKANATLVIPNYSVVPSQKAIQDAISARRQSGNTNTSTASSSRRSSTSAAASSSRRSSSNTTASSRPRTVSKPLPKPQMTLVTPSQGGQATGSNTRSGSGGGDQLVSTLRTTRAQTAQNARRVNGLNQELSSATQRLQLQNQRLAELEARLKALRDK